MDNKILLNTNEEKKENKIHFKNLLCGYLMFILHIILFISNFILFLFVFILNPNFKEYLEYFNNLFVFFFDSIVFLVLIIDLIIISIIPFVTLMLFYKKLEKKTFIINIILIIIYSIAIQIFAIFRKKRKFILIGVSLYNVISLILVILYCVNFIKNQFFNKNVIEINIEKL